MRIRNLRRVRKSGVPRKLQERKISQMPSEFRLPYDKVTMLKKKYVYIHKITIRKQYLLVWI